MNDAQLDGVATAAAASSGRLMVGFNRRFSPLARQAKELFAGRDAPLSIVYRVNAGRIPKDHWTQHENEGGGRIVGEVCHFVDLITFLTEAKPVSVFAESVSARSGRVIDSDSVFITLKFSDGSNGTIAYLAEGDKALAKERVEIFGAGKVFILDDFRSGTTYKDNRETVVTLKAQDKGQADQVRAVCSSILKSAPAPISLEDLISTTRTTFRILDSLREGLPVDVRDVR